MRLAVLSLALVACIPSAPIGPVTPANQAQVAACQSIATLHNGVVVGDFIFGGAASGLAAVGAIVTDPQTKTGVAIGAAIAGATGIVGTAIAGFTSRDFANSQCSSVVGDLPAVVP
jgi:hypothetical protein